MYLADPELSRSYRDTRTETTILGKPSTRNNKRQLAVAMRVPILEITQVKLLANGVASGAAEMNRLCAIWSQHCFFKSGMRVTK